MNEINNEFFYQIKNLNPCYPFISFKVQSKRIICVSNGKRFFQKENENFFCDLVKRIYYLYFSVKDVDIRALEYQLEQTEGGQLLKISAKPQYQNCKSFSLEEINKKKSEIKEKLKELRILGKQEETEDLTASRWKTYFDQYCILEETYRLFFDVFESLQKEEERKVFLNFYVLGSKKQTFFKGISTPLKLNKEIWDLVFSLLKEKYSASENQLNQLAIWVRNRNFSEKKHKDLNKNLYFIFQKKVSEDLKELIENFCLFNQIKTSK